ncbi:DUF2232 domain-containing protein [Paenibacillus lemnae]|uniref:DUF2232 domain-containing protein n=1 Tax=Paenibacillus lemnae TaxID=1330551 RepID=A0A848M1T3_PAELE|nr:DUF2232 domain-containing protein [Paenibacillus lemnae]NMO94211.1 DUF2232 domain-containing protein [Paenibacillus lemnae]
MKQRYTTVVWSIIYLLLLLSLLTPFSMITAFLLVVPVALLFTALNNKSFILHIAPVWLAIALIHPVYLVMAAFFLIPGIVMGSLYRKRAPAMKVLRFGMSALLAELLILLVVATAFFQLNLNEYVDEIVKITTDPLREMGVSGGFTGGMTWTAEQTEALSRMTMLMVPFAMIVSSFLITVVTHAIARPALNRMDIAVPSLKPAREWMLPRSLIWYYLLVVILDFANQDSGNRFIQVLVVNATPLLQMCFMIQALGFFFFLAHTRKWHPVIPVLTAIPIVLFPPMIIIGILDLVFPLRQAFSKNNR